MGAPLRVLIVDDNEAVRMILSDMLNDLGHQVVAEADSLDAAKKAFLEHKPDLVTLDLSLTVSGEGDGISVLKTLLGIDSRARIIIISGNSQGKVKATVEALGAAAFVSKPIDEAEFAAAVIKATQP